MKKIIAGMILTFGLALSIQSAVSAEELDNFDEIQKEYPNATHQLVETENSFKLDVLTEEDGITAEQVWEDIKNNPDKVEWAVEDDGFSTFAAMPYSFSYNFTNIMHTSTVTPIYTTIYNKMNNTTSYAVTASLYRINSDGTRSLAAARHYMGNSNLTASYPVQSGRKYQFTLTGYNNNQGLKKGSALVTQ